MNNRAGAYKDPDSGAMRTEEAGAAMSGISGAGGA